MTVELDEVVDRARAILLVDGSVTEGFRGTAVAQEAGELVVHFRWRQLPYPLQIRVALADVKDLSAPLEVPASAQDWVHWLVLSLMEELDTGAVGWSARRVRGDSIELLRNEPRVGAVPPGFLHSYCVSQRRLSAWEVSGGPGGLDVTFVSELALAGQAATWWVAYVNNKFGAPDVAQLVVVHDGPDVARLQYLQVRDDLPVGLPDSVVVHMLYQAVFDAACEGARTVVSGLEHPAQQHIRGLVEQDDRTFAWRYDGPFLEPPVQSWPTHRRR